MEGERKAEGDSEGELEEWDDQDGERTEMKNKKRDVLNEGAIAGLARNLVLEKFPSTRMTPAKTLSNSGEGSQTDFAL